jgi:hypothetical protein
MFIVILSCFFNYQIKIYENINKVYKVIEYIIFYCRTFNLPNS